MTSPVAARGPSSVVEITNPGGASDVVLVCEHASHFIPPEYANLGLSHTLRHSHIAWDIGALAVARAVSEGLDAALIAPTVSRLIYDCNRPPHSPGAIPARSEVHEIPGNANLGCSERRARVEGVYEPFRHALARFIDSRLASGQPVCLVTIHSFTGEFSGVRREVDIGVLHDSDSRLADALLHACDRDEKRRICRNAPYGPEDGVTHTLAEHAIARGLANVMIEVRNDLVCDESGQRTIARWLVSHLCIALASMQATALAPLIRRDC